MIIAKIIELLPVPEITSENETMDWDALPAEFGKCLPVSYVEFISTYGTGSIGEFLWVLNPFSENRSLNIDQSEYFRYAYQSLKVDFPQYYPRERDEFLPWAFTDNGDCIVWLIDESDPNEWRVCVQASDPAQEEVTSHNTQSFLEALLEKNLTSSILPIQFLEAEKRFVAH